MPAVARKHQLSNSLLYHVFSRGNARQVIFHDVQDNMYFIVLVRRYAHKHNLRVYHWVVMPNHYHLLLELDDPENLSSGMSGLARAYVHYYHKKYQTNGHLWQGRFKSQPVEKDTYLLTCGRYIERNPVEAQMVTSAESYSYSSAAYYVLGKQDYMTNETPFFSTFGKTPDDRKKEYKKFLEVYNAEEEKGFETLETPQGSREFLRRLKKEKGLYLPKRSGRARS